MMSKDHGLRDLQMGKPGHNGFTMTFGKAKEPAL